MKKLFTLTIALLVIGVLFTGCKKDDDSTPANSITITGEFTIGETTFTNPTFDLGEPIMHEGYVAPYYPVKSIPTSNMISIEPLEDFDMGNNIFGHYEYDIYTDAPGTADSYLQIHFYEELAKQSLWIYCNNATTTITKVDEIGGYIEGTFEGTFYIDKKVEVTYPVKGVFKVKRIANPEIN